MTKNYLQQGFPSGLIEQTSQILRLLSQIKLWGHSYIGGSGIRWTSVAGAGACSCCSWMGTSASPSLSLTSKARIPLPFRQRDVRVSARALGSRADCVMKLSPSRPAPMLWSKIILPPGTLFVEQVIRYTSCPSCNRRLWVLKWLLENRIAQKWCKCRIFSEQSYKR